MGAESKEMSKKGANTKTTSSLSSSKTTLAPEGNLKSVDTTGTGIHITSILTDVTETLLFPTQFQIVESSTNSAGAISTLRSTSPKQARASPKKISENTSST